MIGFQDIPEPAAPAILPTAALLQAGPPLEPLKRIFAYHDKEWESFIEEWLSTRKKTYSAVQRALEAGRIDHLCRQPLRSSPTPNCSRRSSQGQLASG